MATSIHLKIDGCAGEDADSKHQGEIEVLAWNFGVSQPVTFTGTGLSGGKADAQFISISKRVDKSSPNLLKYCFNGKHLPEVVLSQHRSGENPIEYVKIKMKDAMIASVNNGGQDGGEMLAETVSIACEKIEFEYTPQKPDGSPDGAVSLKWDIKGNAEA